MSDEAEDDTVHVIRKNKKKRPRRDSATEVAAAPKQEKAEKKATTKKKKKKKRKEAAASEAGEEVDEEEVSSAAAGAAEMEPEPPSATPPADVTFGSLGIDARIRRALARMRWARPTPVQMECVRLALEGKDVLARAPTGSGKTAAYVLPCVHKILQARAASGGGAAGIEVVMLVPTAELCKQVCTVLKNVSRYCVGESSVKTLGIAGDVDVEIQRAQLAEEFHVLVATPGRLAQHLDAGSVSLRQTVHTLVIDEADLMLSYGYDADTRKVVEELPPVCQCFLMSATLSDDVDELRKLVLHNPATVDISDEQHGTANRLAQYYIRCPDKDKHLLLYTLLKLRVIPGKALIFVKTVDDCFKLKLLLDKFSIAAAALDSSLPQNSRISVIEAFNKGIYDYLIATDASTEEIINDDDDGEADAAAAAEPEEKPEAKGKRKKKKKKGGKLSTEYNTARGLDFQSVSAVINFDLPTDVASYKHRIGRTARAGAKGVALSLVAPAQLPLVQMVQDNQIQALNETKSGAVSGAAAEAASLQPLIFKMAQVDGFRYRVESTMQGISKAVRTQTRTPTHAHTSRLASRSSLRRGCRASCMGSVAAHTVRYR